MVYAQSYREWMARVFLAGKRVRQSSGDPLRAHLERGAVRGARLAGRTLVDTPCGDA